MTQRAAHTSAAMPLIVHSHSEEETVDAAAAFARGLVPGDVVAITGDLGAGKTRFVRGICRTLGTDHPVSSPTFTLLHEYHAAGISVYHFDFYRIASAAELREIGFGEYLADERGVCLIEWADRVREHLPPDRYDAHLEFGADRGERVITIRRNRGGPA